LLCIKETEIALQQRIEKDVDIEQHAHQPYFFMR
jgi:hypothetical protein